jgi:hypothetical protein
MTDPDKTWLKRDSSTVIHSRRLNPKPKEEHGMETKQRDTVLYQKTTMCYLINSFVDDVGRPRIPAAIMSNGKMVYDSIEAFEFMSVADYRTYKTI